MMESGEYLRSAQQVAKDGDAMPPDAGSEHARGRYLVRSTCVECHGMGLGGMKATPGAPPIPDLSLIISAYSADEFHHLMKTGKGLGDRDLGLMRKRPAKRMRISTPAKSMRSMPIYAPLPRTDRLKNDGITATGRCDCDVSSPPGHLQQIIDAPVRHAVPGVFAPLREHKLRQTLARSLVQTSDTLFQRRVRGEHLGHLAATNTESLDLLRQLVGRLMETLQALQGRDHLASAGQMCAAGIGAEFTLTAEPADDCAGENAEHDFQHDHAQVVTLSLIHISEPTRPY